MQCESCPAILPSSQVDWHRQRFHASQRMWACGDCGMATTDFPHALAHSLLEGHGLGSLEQVQPERKKIVQEPPLPPGPLVNESRDVGIEETLPKLESESPVHSTVRNPRENVACLLCGKTTKGKFQRLLYHVLACAQILPFACAACHKPFARRQDLNRHRRTACQEADVLIVDKLANEARAREGLRSCFGVESLNWRGFV